MRLEHLLSREAPLRGTEKSSRGASGAVSSDRCPAGCRGGDPEHSQCARGIRAREEFDMLGKQDIWEKRVDSKESPRIKRKSGGRPALRGQARLQEDKENFYN